MIIKAKLCHSFGPALSGALCAVLSALALAAPVARGATTSVNWRVIPDDTNYPTRDVIVAAVVIGDTNVGATLPANPATADCSAYFNAAMSWLSGQGGGTVFVPAGMYCFSNSLSVPNGVTLRGRWVPPGPMQPVTGTIFKIYAGQNISNAAPFLSVGGGSGGGLQGLSFWYPNQWATNWQYYPYTIQGSLVGTEELTLVNSYQGIYIPGANFDYVTDIYGCPLTAGLFIQHGPSLPRFYRINYSPNYWAWSGLPGSPTNAADWTALTTNMLGNTNSVAVDIRQTAGANLEGCVISGYCYGIRNASDPTYGSGTIAFHNDVVTNCTEGHRVEATAGISVFNCTFASTPTGIAYHQVGGRGDNFYACTLTGGSYSVLDDPNGSPLHTITLQNCVLTGPASINNNATLQMIGSSFTANTTTNILLNSGVNGVAIKGGTNCGPANIVNHSGLSGNNYVVITNATQPEPALLFPYPTMAHPGWRRPLQLTLFNVMNYGATGDGVHDDTAAIQAAIYAAETNGGGIVFFPVGTNLVSQPLSVTNGVELRGIAGLLNPNKDQPNILLINTGANHTNAPAFVTLGDYCGIRGINLQYVSQTWSNGIYIPYPYTVQCSGRSNYVWNILAGNSYQVVDFNGAHGGVADGCVMSGLVNTYKFDGGSTDCQIQYGALKPLGFYPGVNQNPASNDPNSISRTAINDIVDDATNITLIGIYTHDSHALVSVRGGDQINILEIHGEQLQNGILFESGQATVNLLDAGPSNVNHNDGTGSYDYWFQTNFSGSVTSVSPSATSEDENYTLRMDSTNAQFVTYGGSLNGGYPPLEAVKVAGMATIIGGNVGGCTLEVTAGGSFNVLDSTLGVMPYAPQAGFMTWTTNCQPNPANSFIAANLNNQTPIANGITVDTSNLASIVVDRSPSLGSTRDTNGDVLVGWHLANNGAGTGTAANNFNFTVPGRYFTTNGTWPTVNIEVYYLEDTDGTLSVYYRSTNSQMKLGQTYTLAATNALWRDYSFTINDANFATTNGVDIQLVATNCDPVLEFVAINSTNYLGVPPQLIGPPPVASFTTTPTNGIRPLAVVFSDTSAGGITNLLWDFGDGQTTNTAAGAVVAHTYQTSGTFTVSLVAGGLGGSDTNTQAGLVTVLTPTPPQISGISLFSGDSLVLQGSGGPTNGGYYYWLRSSTNLLLPLTSWSIVATNPFDGQGNFSNQIPLTPGAPPTFYRLQMP